MLDHVVKEFPITKGVLQRQGGSVKAVSDVSLEVIRGETFGLVGESGCGKSTLGRLIVSLERLTSGSIRFDGVEVSRLRGGSLRRARQDLQLMFQDPYASLDPRMRIASTLREPLQAQHLGNRPEQEARIRELLGEVGLPATAMELYPHEFSGGQRQRIGFARALTVRPRLIVADEPVSALDVSVQSQVLNLMRRLQGEYDLTYIFISHDLSVVRYLADRIGVMYLGKLVEIGPADEVYERQAPSLHRRSAGSHSGCGPRAGAGQGQGSHEGRAAVGGQPAVRLPVPDPVPEGPADLRRADTPPPALRDASPPGCLPLPSAGAARAVAGDPSEGVECLVPVPACGQERRGQPGDHGRREIWCA